MVNAFPIFGWIFSFLMNAFMAVPFYFIWDFIGIGESFFYFLPERFQVIGFWNTVGLFIVASIIKQFSPIAINNSNNNS